jgi:thymidylate synthase
MENTIIKIINNLDKTYTALLQDILDNGTEKKDRTGTGTLSVFGRQIRHKMSEGFPLLTTKKMPFKTVVTELIWFLRSDTNIKYLVDNNCHIWDGDAYKNYLSKINNGRIYPTSFTQEEFINKIKTDDEFAKKWGELGPIYGKQWRNWGGEFSLHIGLERDGSQDKINFKQGIDQIANLISELKTNPDSRRLMVNAWNVGELDQMVLPPCHYGFQVYTRELSLKEQAEAYNSMLEKQNYNPKWQSKIKDIDNLSDGELMTTLQSLPGPTRAISLMWNQRSVDTFLGLPFNIASYGLLLTMIADEVNMVPDELIGNLGDVHLYSNHIEQAKEQIGRDYTHEERHDMLKAAMGDFYSTAVSEMVPFGGGLSEYYDSYKIPKKTREPFPLPTVRVRDGIFSSSINDFILSDYQSHETIKAPLSN